MRALLVKSESPDQIASLIARHVRASELDAGGRIDLAEVDAPICVLDNETFIIAATPAARALLSRFHLADELPMPLPESLIRELIAVPFGAAIVWHPPSDLSTALGFTRYRLGEDRVLLLMREITESQRELSKRLHRQRLEATGGLVARIAHDLRTPLSSIVYNIDLLEKQNNGSGSMRDIVRDIHTAAEGMRRAIAGLLDYARLGPPISATVSLREIVARVSTFVRPVFRAGSHELRISLHDEEARIQGNPITIEQILVNLLVNATEAAERPIEARISSELVAPNILVRVSDSGPGIPPEHRERVFEPFFSSKPNNTGLGLTIAREAAASLGGQLCLEKTTSGCSFAVLLPAARRAFVEGVAS